MADSLKKSKLRLEQDSVMLGVIDEIKSLIRHERSKQMAAYLLAQA